jgi:hypothetical protein
MTPTLPILLMFAIVGVLVVVAVIAGLASAKAERERRLRLESLARQHGWTFEPPLHASLSDLYPHVEIFNRGHSRKAFNLMSAEVDLAGDRFRMLAGDYTYKITTSNGKSTSTTTYRLSFLYVHWPEQWRVPDLLIRPEGIFDKLKGAIGFDDIDFESEEFSRKFWVRSSNKRFAYDVIHPRMIDFLMSSRPGQIELANGSAGFFGNNTRWEPAEFEQSLGWLDAFFALWPDFVRQNVRTAVGSADDTQGAAT